MSFQSNLSMLAEPVLLGEFITYKSHVEPAYRWSSNLHQHRLVQVTSLTAQCEHSLSRVGTPGIKKDGCDPMIFRMSEDSHFLIRLPFNYQHLFLPSVNSYARDSLSAQFGSCSGQIGSEISAEGQKLIVSRLQEAEELISE